MTKDQLDSLTKAAMEMSQISVLINEMDDDETPQAAKALLTAQSGCFTALVHIAGMLREMTMQARVKGETRWVQ